MKGAAVAAAAAMIGGSAGRPEMGVVEGTSTDGAASGLEPGAARERAIGCEIGPGIVPGVC